SPAAFANFGGQEAKHARCDELLDQRRVDRTPRSGIVPDTGPAASEPDSLQSRPISNVRLLDCASSREEGDRPAADELSAKPKQSGFTRVKGAPAQCIPV